MTSIMAIYQTYAIFRVHHLNKNIKGTFDLRMSGNLFDFEFASGHFQLESSFFRDVNGQTSFSESLTTL